MFYERLEDASKKYISLGDILRWININMFLFYNVYKNIIVIML